MESKFKVGDRVRCVLKGFRSAGWKNGYEFTITAVKTNDGIDYYVMDEKKSCPGIWENSLELVIVDISEFIGV